MHFSTIYDAIKINYCKWLLFRLLRPTGRTLPAKQKNNILPIFIYAKTIK
jgi:hypothetical protein